MASWDSFNSSIPWRNPLELGAEDPPCCMGHGGAHCTHILAKTAQSWALRGLGSQPGCWPCLQCPWTAWHCQVFWVTLGQGSCPFPRGRGGPG